MHVSLIFFKASKFFLHEQKIFKFELKLQPFQGIWLFVVASKVHPKTVAALVSTKSK